MRGTSRASCLWLRRGPAADVTAVATWKRIPIAVLAARWPACRASWCGWASPVELGIAARSASPSAGRCAVVYSPRRARPLGRRHAGNPAGGVHLVLNAVAAGHAGGPRRCPRAARARGDAAGGERGRPGGAKGLRRAAWTPSRGWAAAAPGWVIAGDGPDAADLRERADRLGLGERVRFLGYRRDMPEVLASADVFVLASRKDSLANVMLVAMSLGVPVVATETGRRAAGARRRSTGRVGGVCARAGGARAYDWASFWTVWTALMWPRARRRPAGASRVVQRGADGEGRGGGAAPGDASERLPLRARGPSGG
jgi:hypothetical protein